MKILFLVLSISSFSIFAQDSTECEYLRSNSFREFASTNPLSEYSKREAKFTEVSTIIDQEIQRSCREGFKGDVSEGSLSNFIQDNNWIRGCIGSDRLGNANVLDLECQKLLKGYVMMIRSFRAGKSSVIDTNCTENISSTERGIVKPAYLNKIKNKKNGSSTASPQ